MTQEQHTQINWMDRDDVVEVLEEYGFAVQDCEHTDDLRNDLRANIQDGTIPANVLEQY